MKLRKEKALKTGPLVTYSRRSETARASVSASTTPSIHVWKHRMCYKS